MLLLALARDLLLQLLKAIEDWTKSLASRLDSEFAKTSRRQRPAASTDWLEKSFLRSYPQAPAHWIADVRARINSEAAGELVPTAGPWVHWRQESGLRRTTAPMGTAQSTTAPPTSIPGQMPALGRRHCGVGQPPASADLRPAVELRRPGSVRSVRKPAPDLAARQRATPTATGSAPPTKQAMAEESEDLIRPAAHRFSQAPPLVSFPRGEAEAGESARSKVQEAGHGGDSRLSRPTVNARKEQPTRRAEKRGRGAPSRPSEIPRRSTDPPIGSLPGRPPDRSRPTAVLAMGGATPDERSERRTPLPADPWPALLEPVGDWYAEIETPEEARERLRILELEQEGKPWNG